jgi:hypothetical protein
MGPVWPVQWSQTLLPCSSHTIPELFPLDGSEDQERQAPILAAGLTGGRCVCVCVCVPRLPFRLLETRSQFLLRKGPDTQ